MTVSYSNINPPFLVVQQDAQSLELSLDITEDLDYFKGHYPEFLILPGVAQMAWAVHFAQEFFKISPSIKNVERLKFTCPIRPKMKVRLRLSLDSHKKCVSFEFFFEKQMYSQGRLSYD